MHNWLVSFIIFTGFSGIGIWLDVKDRKLLRDTQAFKGAILKQKSSLAFKQQSVPFVVSKLIADIPASNLYHKPLKDLHSALSTTEDLSAVWSKSLKANLRPYERTLNTVSLQSTELIGDFPVYMQSYTGDNLNKQMSDFISGLNAELTTLTDYMTQRQYYYTKLGILFGGIVAVSLL